MGKSNLQELSDIYEGGNHSFGVIDLPPRKKAAIIPPLQFKIGELVEVFSIWGGGFTQDTKEAITKIEKRYDEITGKPYPIYKTSSGQEFDGRNGTPITPPLAYAIRGIKLHERRATTTIKSTIKEELCGKE